MSLNGIDIASYQKDMDCSKVKADFIIIKATQGVNYFNPSFEKQYVQAKASGKLLGIYHYATGCGAITEADFFLAKIQSHIRDAILCLDWETNEKGGKNAMFNSSGEVNYVNTFMERVHDLSGVYPLLYMSASVTRRRDWSKVAEKSALWVAQYGNPTKLTDYLEKPWRDNKGLGAWKEPPAIHQYTSSGTIEGYRQTSLGKLDMNIAYLTRQEWDSLARGTYKLPSSEKEITPDLIMDVIDHKYSAGADRVIKLHDAGYNDVLVQKKINECYKLAKQIEEVNKPKAGKYWECVVKFL